MGGWGMGNQINAWIKIKSQNLRLFLAYTGRKYDYSKASGLNDYNTRPYWDRNALQAEGLLKEEKNPLGLAIERTFPFLW